MGIYYFLLNDTKKHRIHLDYHVKFVPMTENEAVHYAIVNYMMENQGDNIRMLSDANGADELEYENVDLIKYEYNDPEKIQNIINKMNKIYNGNYVLDKDL